MTDPTLASDVRSVRRFVLIALLAVALASAGIVVVVFTSRSGPAAPSADKLLPSRFREVGFVDHQLRRVHAVAFRPRTRRGRIETSGAGGGSLYLVASCDTGVVNVSFGSS